MQNPLKFNKMSSNAKTKGRKEVLDRIREIVSDAKAELVDIKQFIYTMETNFISQLTRSGSTSKNSERQGYKSFASH
jgi:hypothetical protein